MERLIAKKGDGNDNESLHV